LWRIFFLETSVRICRSHSKKSFRYPTATQSSPCFSSQSLCHHTVCEGSFVLFKEWQLDKLSQSWVDSVVPWTPAIVIYQVAFDVKRCLHMAVEDWEMLKYMKRRCISEGENGINKSKLSEPSTSKARWEVDWY
jgi:hypothetical protein